MTTIADPRDILLAPVISENSYGLIEEGTYTFLCTRTRTRPDQDCRREGLRRHRDQRHTANRQGSAATRFGYGKRKDTKRALVTLSADSKPIEIFGGRSRKRLGLDEI